MWVNVLLHISSTNSKSCYFYEKSDFASSRTRRYAYRITAQVKPEYKVRNSSSPEWGYEESCRLDQSKIPQNVKDSALMDLWYFTVWKSEVADDKDYSLKSTYAESAKIRETDNSWRCVPVNDEGELLMGIGIKRLARFLVKESRVYYSRQKEVVSYCNTANEQVMCYNCFEHSTDCTCTYPSLHGPEGRVMGPPLTHDPLKDNAGRPDEIGIAGAYSEEQVEQILNSSLNPEAQPFVPNSEVIDADLPTSSEGKTLVTLEDVIEASGTHIERVCESNDGLVTLDDLIRASGIDGNSIHVEKQSYMPTTSKSVKKEIMVQSKLLEFLKNNNSTDASDLVTSVFSNAKDTASAILTFLDNVCDAFTAQVVSRLLTKFLIGFSSDPYMMTATMMPQVFEDIGVGDVLRSNSPSYHLLRFGDNLLGSFASKSMCCNDDKPTPVTDFFLRKRCFDIITKSPSPKMSLACQNYLLKEGPTFYDRFLANGNHCEKKMGDGSIFKFFPCRKKKNKNKTMHKLAEFDNNLRTHCPSHIRDVGVPLVSLAAICCKMYKLLSVCSVTIVDGHAGIDLESSELTRFDEEREENEKKKRMFAMAFQPPGKPGMRNNEVMNRCENNIVVLKNGIDKSFTNAFVVRDGLMLAPDHFFSDAFKLVKNNYLTLELLRFPISGDVVPGNARMVVMVDRTCIHKFRGNNGEFMDLVAVSIKGSDMFTNMYDKFPEQYNPMLGMCTMVSKDNAGIIKRVDRPFAVKSQTSCYNDTKNYEDGTYDTFDGYYGWYDCKKGMCGSPIVDATCSDAKIAGIHLGGNEDKGVGVFACVTKNMIDEACESLNLMPAIMAHSGLNKTGISRGCHPKNPLFAIECESSKVFPVGTFATRSTHKSRVVPTIIADEVQSKFPSVNLDYGPPPLKGPSHNDSRYPYKALYSNLSGKYAYYPPNLVAKAVSDYQSRVFSRAATTKLDHHCLRPLNNYEIVNGIDGLAFVNGINMSAGGGSKYKGRKSNYAHRVGDKWDFEEHVWADIERADKLARTGQRFWGTFNAFPKDEPTTKAGRDKGKVRTVFGSDLVLQCLCRKYFAGTIRWFNVNSTTTECSVGINPSSAVWHHMLNSLVERDKKKSLSRMFATDYSKFDLNMPPNVIDAAFDFLIRFNMEHGQFSSDDFMAMVTLKEEILKAIVNCNGDAVFLLSILCSGVPLTSLLGSVCNSIMVRTCYYALVADVKFSDAISMMTFSDDIFGTISDNVVNEFNMQTMCAKMGEWGTSVTSAQKDGKSMPKTIHLNDVDFLKRAFRFDYEFGGVYVGPLKEQSILKPLVSMIKPTSVTEEFQLAQNINAAMDEYLLHGRRKYNIARKKLTGIAVHAGIEKVADRLTLTFDEALTNWKSKYAECDEAEITNPLVSGAIRARQVLSEFIPFI
jgi:hypothetical protein